MRSARNSIYGRERRGSEEMMTDPLTQISWQSLTSIIGVGGLLVIVVEVSKRLKIVSGARAVALTALLLGQVFAQVAFWRCSGWSAQNVTDAGLVGFVGALVAVGGHTVVRKLANGKPKENGH